MIFVSVGTANKGFNRLLQECDQIARRTSLTFFAQTGSSSYQPAHLPFQAWLTSAQMQQHYQQASAFVVHGGFGTLSETLQYGKPIFVVPRRAQDGEAVNNQTDLAVKLHSLGLVHYVEQVAHLEQALLQREKLVFRPKTLTNNVPDLILDYIAHLTCNK